MTPHQLPHPGHYIQRVYLDPFKRKAADLASDLQLDLHSVDKLRQSRRDVTLELSEKLSKMVGRSAASWLRMQADWCTHQSMQREE